MTELTAVQQEVLDYIGRHISIKGYPPTRGEICMACGFRSLNAAQEILKRLKEKGYIDMERRAARSIRILIQPKIPT